MQLFTVEFERLHVVSVYDNKGRKTGERREGIKQVLHDLPYSTAKSYLDAAENGRITPQIVETRQSSGASQKSKVVYHAKASVPARPAKSAPSSIQNAAATGDMSAAISKVK